MRRPQGDEGSVLVLVLGLAGLLLTLVAVVADVSVVVLAKRSVASVADGAAVSAAQGLDQEAFYRQGAGAGVPLSAASVADRVAAYQAAATADQPGDRHPQRRAAVRRLARRGARAGVGRGPGARPARAVSAPHGSSASCCGRRDAAAAPIGPDPAGRDQPENAAPPLAVAVVTLLLPRSGPTQRVVISPRTPGR